MHSILIVEDNHALSQAIVLALKSDEFQFTQAYTCKEALAAIHSQNFDLLLLDIQLPDGNGLELLSHYRQLSSRSVILMTAQDTEMDVVLGLESGADDYITKPFSLMILRARVNAQLRKIKAKSQIISVPPYHFDFEKMIFFKGEKPVELSKNEQKLLRLLLEHQGQTLRRETLVDRLWTDGADYVDENALSVTINRLRNKLEDEPSHPRFIKTVYGLGYSWEVH